MSKVVLSEGHVTPDSPIRNVAALLPDFFPDF
jgi:hypothetical protein